MLFITIALCAAQSTMAESEKDRMTLMRTEREAGVALHMNAMGQMTKENVKDRRNSYCMIDFTLGVKDPAPGQHECYSGPSQASFDAETAEESHETTYNASSEEYDRARCTIAAARAGAHQSQHFMLHQQREDCHPRGCFVSKCDAVLNTSTSGGVANDEWCYFYNPISKDPDPSLEPAICGYDANKPTTHNLKGQAVCERKRFLFGKTGTVKHCPDGYTTISNSTDAGKADSSTLGHGAEQMCHSVVGCLASKTAALSVASAARTSRKRQSTTGSRKDVSLTSVTSPTTIKNSPSIKTIILTLLAAVEMRPMSRSPSATPCAKLAQGPQGVGIAVLMSPVEMQAQLRDKLSHMRKAGQFAS